jgi:hypothetical protein
MASADLHLAGAPFTSSNLHREGLLMRASLGSLGLIASCDSGARDNRSLWHTPCVRSPFVLAIVATACASQVDVRSVRSEVQAFAHSIASDVTRDGPNAWRRYLSDAPEFFMIVNGHMVFASGAAAAAAVDGLSRLISKVELRWGDVHVDPLGPDLAIIAAPYHEVRVGSDGKRVEEDGYFTAVAQRRDSRWWLRDAHWSVPLPAAAMP